MRIRLAPPLPLSSHVLAGRAQPPWGCFGGLFTEGGVRSSHHHQDLGCWALRLWPRGRAADGCTRQHGGGERFDVDLCG
jgi:hypothetical protein